MTVLNDQTTLRNKKQTTVLVKNNIPHPKPKSHSAVIHKSIIRYPQLIHKKHGTDFKGSVWQAISTKSTYT